MNRVTYTHAHMHKDPRWLTDREDIVIVKTKASD